MTTILVVDDEANIRDLVGVYLSAAGYSIAYAADGNAAMEQFRAVAPDLVVLDIMLPGMSGAEVCASIRAESATPILMLTARESDLDKVSLLEAGADDYVLKPFSPPELVARVRAVLRRTATASALASGPGSSAESGTAIAPEPTAIQLGCLMLDPATREVTVDDEPITLTAREFDLLMALVKRPGIVLSREQLLEEVVGFAEYTDARGVDVHVRHLREKLGDDASDPRFIETVRGVGYRAKRAAQ